MACKKRNITFPTHTDLLEASKTAHSINSLLNSPRQPINSTPGATSRGKVQVIIILFIVTFERSVYAVEFSSSYAA